MRKLVQLSAFWKNDQPGGVGVALTHEIGDLDYILNIIVENYECMYRESHQQSTVHELVADLLEQLAIIGAKTDRSMPELFMAIGNIYLLSHYHFIPNDEWNGLLLAYAES